MAVKRKGRTPTMPAKRIILDLVIIPGADFQIFLSSYKIKGSVFVFDKKGLIF
jgi:hypothetical protein